MNLEKLSAALGKAVILLLFFGSIVLFAIMTARLAQCGQSLLVVILFVAMFLGILTVCFYFADDEDKGK
jgi:hypothetical protein